MENGWISFEGDSTKVCPYFIDSSGCLVGRNDKNVELELLVVKSEGNYTLPLSHNFRDSEIRRSSVLDEGLIVDFSNLLECDNNPQKSIFLKSDALGVGLDKHFKFFYPISNGVVYCEWSKELNLMYHASPLKYVESYLSLVGELTRDSKAVHGAYSIDGSPLMYVLIFNPPVNYGDIVQKFEYEDLFLEHIKNERDKALLKDFGDAQARMRLPASMN